MADLRVTRSAAELRYLLHVRDLEAGFIAYGERDGTVTLYHTEVDRSVEGRGLGSTLVRGALEDIRERGLRLVPVCPFVKAYLRRHPEYGDLVAT